MNNKNTITKSKVNPFIKANISPQLLNVFLMHTTEIMFKALNVSNSLTEEKLSLAVQGNTETINKLVDVYILFQSTFFWINESGYKSLLDHFQDNPGLQKTLFPPSLNAMGR